MAELPTTKLEAVNEILAAIGEAPVNTLEGDLTAEVQIVVNHLHNTSRKVQLEGWWFNEEENFELSRDVETNEVTVPGNTLNIDITYEVANVDLVQRGTKLYDKIGHTFELGFNPKCTITFFLEWDDLPEAAREYIKIKTARIFQDRFIGSGDQHTFSSNDEAIARATMDALNAENQDASIFDTYDIASIVARRRPYPRSFF